MSWELGRCSGKRAYECDWEPCWSAVLGGWAASGRAWEVILGGERRRLHYWQISKCIGRCHALRSLKPTATPAVRDGLTVQPISPFFLSLALQILTSYYVHRQRETSNKLQGTIEQRVQAWELSATCSLLTFCPAKAKSFARRRGNASWRVQFCSSRDSCNYYMPSSTETFGFDLAASVFWTWRSASSKTC